MRTAWASSLKPLGACLLAVMLCAGLALPAYAITSNTRFTSTVTVTKETAYRGVFEGRAEAHTGLFGADDPVDGIDPSGHDDLDSMIMPVLASLFTTADVELAGPATGGLPWKNVSVDAKILYGSGYKEADILGLIQSANEIYAQANIKINLASTTTWDYETTLQKTDGELSADSVDRGPDGREIPGKNIADMTEGQNEDHISAYFGSAFNMPPGQEGSGVAAFSLFAPHFTSPPAPSCFLSQNTLYWILAHEIGHVLTQAGHEDDPDNLMAASGGDHKFLLNAQQVQIMRSNKLVHNTP